MFLDERAEGSLPVVPPFPHPLPQALPQRRGGGTPSPARSPRGPTLPGTIATPPLWTTPVPRRTDEQLGANLEEGVPERRRTEDITQPPWPCEGGIECELRIQLRATGLRRPRAHAASAAAAAAALEAGGLIEADLSLQYVSKVRQPAASIATAAAPPAAAPAAAAPRAGASGAGGAPSAGPRAVAVPRSAKRRAPARPRPAAARRQCGDEGVLQQPALESTRAPPAALQAGGDERRRGGRAAEEGGRLPARRAVEQVPEPSRCCGASPLKAGTGSGGWRGWSIVMPNDHTSETVVRVRAEDALGRHIVDGARRRLLRRRVAASRSTTTTTTTTTTRTASIAIDGRLDGLMPGRIV